jgi:predicted metal-binding membrane protein
MHPPVHMAALMAGMMMPLAISTAHVVAERSLRSRRLRAVTEFLAGFASVWFAFGLFAIATVRVVGTLLGSSGAFGILLIVALLWQLSWRRRRYAEACGRVHVGPPTGWRSDAHTMVAGAAQALRCIKTCWASMLAMAAAPNMLLMIIVLGANLAEWAPGRNPFARVRRLRPLPVYASLVAGSLLSLVH